MQAIAKKSRYGPVEFLVLRTVHHLGDDAYGAAIQRHIAALTGREMPLGQIYTTLERLETKGLLLSKESLPEAVRGGRTKRLYQLEETCGVAALEDATAMYTMISQFLEKEKKDHGRSTGLLPQTSA